LLYFFEVPAVVEFAVHSHGTMLRGGGVRERQEISADLIQSRRSHAEEETEDGLTGMETPRRALIITSLLLVATALVGCGARGDEAGTAPILLFAGAGTSRNDVAALKAILESNQLAYTTVNSSQLNAMGDSQIRGHRLLIVPGGNFVDIGNGLTSGTTANIRSAVQHGLNYLGICAGGFFAGHSPYNGLNLTSGVRFGFYAAEGRGVRKAAVAIAGVGAPTLEHYWEDGPQFTGWGTVVGKYPDGTPAVVEGTFGSGWVILSGVHPEAPADWRHGMTFATPVSDDNAYAATLIHAALNRTSLPHY
jgi:glutamine amidotransferase-like uncharacterized protein